MYGYSGNMRMVFVPREQARSAQKLTEQTITVAGRAIAVAGSGSAPEGY
jgi:hypothetical protein